VEETVTSYARWYDQLFLQKCRSSKEAVARLWLALKKEGIV
jgi:hypothetical protein